MPGWIFIVVFLILFALVMLVVGGGWNIIRSQRKRRLAEMITPQQGARDSMQDIGILADLDLKGVSGLNNFPIYGNIQRKLRLGAVDTTPEVILGLMAALAIAGAVLGLRITAPVLREAAVIAAAGLGAFLPFAFVSFKAEQRMRAFEALFPEALDFLARSMRAGHAFSISLEMMAEETPDPVGSEFRWIFHEQNLGASLESTLRNFSERIPLLDAKLFVSAVLLQRETGGNLAEILMKLSHIIRERFRLKGQVRAASAHGRITAIVLSAMPIVTLILLTWTAPDYFNLMMIDPSGRWIVIGAITLQLIGYLWMRKIINIKV